MGYHRAQLTPAQVSKILLGPGMKIEVRCPVCLAQVDLKIVASGDYGFVLEMTNPNALGLKAAGPRSKSGS